MHKTYSTKDYSNWPDWMVRWRITIIEREIRVINQKIEEEKIKYNELLKSYEKDALRYEKHKHLLDKIV